LLKQTVLESKNYYTVASAAPLVNSLLKKEFDRGFIIVLYEYMVYGFID